MEISQLGAGSVDSPSIKKERDETASSHTNGTGLVNGGISNGFSKEHSKDKGHRSDSRDKDRHKDKYRDKHSSSSSKDRDKHRDKERSKEKDKERSKEKERSKDKEREKDKERKHREEKKGEHKSGSSSSSPSKDHKSSSGSKDKERHGKESSSEKHRDHKHSGKDKDQRHKGSSSSSADKKHSGEKDRHGKEKSRHSEGGENHSGKDKSKHRSEEIKVKQEPQESFEKKDEYFEQQEVKIPSPVKVKSELAESDDDTPLMERANVQKVKRKLVESDDDDVPLMNRKKPKKESAKKRRKKEEPEDEEDFKPAKKAKTSVKKKSVQSETESPKKGRKKKEEEEKEVWKWWEEDKPQDGTKWKYLEHQGPVFAPPYEKLPSSIKMKYNGKELVLSENAEEVATFYARMLDHDFVTKKAFNDNFFKDWRKMMTPKERELITDLKKCDFRAMHQYFLQKSEERKAMTKEEKLVIKQKNEEVQNVYGLAVIDGHNEKIGNYKIEPPGLFRGRGEHPKMGKLKRRVMPEDVIINCSKDAPVPKAPAGHHWKEVRHDNSVTWLASWTENVQGQVKYVMLNPSSKLKGEKDWQKYETARRLAKSINKIRDEYREDFRHKEMRIRQRSVALYFIDRLALRAGNEKDEDQADTVGCCSLRVEHISLHEEKDGKQYVVVFDFLGKDSIRYYNEVPVEKRVFKNLQLFMENKAKGDDLFDRLNTAILNKHLNDLMDGLTAKVFRTYNASITLQQQLDELTDSDASIPEKLLAYNRANRAVAILCNHQRSVPKSHAKSMENLKGKIDAKKEVIRETEQEFNRAKSDFRRNRSEKDKIIMEKKKKAVERLKDQLAKFEVQAMDREENKEIALGTSKLNYLDPRISVAWCKKNDVPVEKIFNKTQREKFRWAIDMATAEYVF